MYAYDTGDCINSNSRYKYNIIIAIARENLWKFLFIFLKGILLIIVDGIIENGSESLRLCVRAVSVGELVMFYIWVQRGHKDFMLLIFYKFWPQIGSRKE